jgi:hypothetical protein
MWVARAFEKTGNKLVQEIQLPGLSGNEVRPLLRVRADDPMYDAYPITTAIAGVLRKHLSAPLNIEGFEWFLEFDADYV